LLLLDGCLPAADVRVSKFWENFDIGVGYLCVHSVYALVLPTFVNNYNIAGRWVIIFKWHYQGWKYIGVGQLSIARKNMQR